MISRTHVRILMHGFAQAFVVMLFLAQLTEGIAHASPEDLWREAGFSNLSGLMSFLNGAGGERVGEFKALTMKMDTAGLPVDIKIVYRIAPSHADIWHYRKCIGPELVVRLVNGNLPDNFPNLPHVLQNKTIRNFIVYGIPDKVKPRNDAFYVFYQPLAPRDTNRKWQWTTKNSPEELVTQLNNSHIGKARITSIYRPNAPAVDGPQDTFYAFYQGQDTTQAVGGWSSRNVTTNLQYTDVIDVLNASYTVRPLDNKSVVGVHSGGSIQYQVFQPPGFLTFTRKYFLSNDTKLEEFRDWKFSNGFDYYVEIAEELPKSLLEGRQQIRNLFRDYYYYKGVRYVLMVGDSVQEPQVPETLENGATWVPPRAKLSEKWNLPLGYYLKEFFRKDGCNDCNVCGCYTIPAYTTSFYSDLSNKDSYTLDESYYQGDYKIYVGVIPVKTHSELSNVLDKIMTVQIAPPTMTWLFDGEKSYDPNYSLPLFNDVKSIATVLVDMIMIVFKYGVDKPEDIRATFFGQLGMLQTFAHGYAYPSPNGFTMALTSITADDADNFQWINPLFLDNSCFASGYYYGEGYDREFLKATKGPAAISPVPVSYDNALGRERLNMHYYESLFTGHSIGSSFYDNAKDTIINSDVMFGDPSLVVVGAQVD